MVQIKVTQLAILVIVIACGACGKPQDGDAPPTPDLAPAAEPPGTLSLIVPAVSFVARAPLVQISGSGTHFGPSTTVDFGDPEVKVTQIEVGSNTNLRVQLQISDRARLGSHDITTVTPGALSGGQDERLTLRGALTLRPSLEADMTGNSSSIQQGGVANFSVSNLDHVQSPFLMGNQVRVSAGMLLLGVDNITSTHIAGLGIVDPVGAPGRLGFTLAQRDSRGQEVLYVLDPIGKHNTQVAARSGAVLTQGVLLTGESISAPMVSNLYKVTTGADDQVLVLALSSLGSGLINASPLGVLSDDGGRFSAGTFVLPSLRGSAGTMLGYLPRAGSYHLALTTADLTGAMTGYGYGITARVVPGKRLPSLKEPATPDSAAQPLGRIDLDGAYFGEDGAIDDVMDEDFVLFRATRTGRVYATAVRVGVPAQPLVGLLRADCKTTVAADRVTQQEAAVTAGTSYCVRVVGPPSPYRLLLSHDLP